jgi:outer membrane receptor protein involved in Fe transport
MFNKYIVRFLLAGMLAIITSAAVSAQVTTSEIVGTVIDGQGNPVAGASVEATHVPSGTVFNTETNESGRYSIPGMRVGGPYTVKIQAAGFKEQVRENLQLALGTATTLNFDMSAAIDVEVTVTNDAVFSEARTGASTSIPTTAIQALPRFSGQISDFTRLTPQASGNSFAGADSRLNNITVDGANFNSSFGLGIDGQPGSRTNVAPISMDAIEELQVNVAPYDVRQGNFVGAGINTVTKSGTNDYNGSIYYRYRRPGLVGKNAGDLPFDPGAFKFDSYGFRVGGPLPFFNFGENDGPMFISGKNKVFFFLSHESDEFTQPGTLFRANNGGEPAVGNTTRVLASDLNALSNYLRTNFGYETGPYQGYTHATPAKKWLVRGDWNINSKNRFNLRYIHLDSDTDVLLSNSTSLGFGNRRGTVNGLNFQNSNYKILENIRSTVGELNSQIGDWVSNSLMIGYTKQDESRDSLGSFFPFVDILQGGATYTSFGFEPFTPNNELRYNSLQVQDNMSFYRGPHTFAVGTSFERYRSENVFFQGAQSVYVYNSLADFYADANGYLANPNRTTTTISHRFQVGYSNVPGLEKPIQNLKVDYWGFYGQDTWKVRDNLTLTMGLRADVPFFAETGYVNPQANGFTYRDEAGQSVQYRTEKLPDPNILWSPRFGVNWSPLKSGRIQVRGGSGVFTARPAYVWISNQIGNNGILTGFEDTGATGNAFNRPFNPNPNRYKPTNVTGAPAASYALALTDPGFKFPQLWRTSAAADVRIPFGFIAGTEYTYSRDVNGVYYINANLPAAQTTFTGVDNRPRWTSNRINAPVTNAVVLKNQNVGRQWNIAATLERPFNNGLFFKGAYSYGEARNTVDPGSIAAGTWQSNPHSGDPNNPGLGISAAHQGHRVFLTGSFSREYFKFGGTTISAFWERRLLGNSSYIFSSDLNGDGGTNDLIYIPRDTSEMNFGTITTSAGVVVATPAQQAAAWEAYIQQDEYLSKNRGRYAERGALFLPYVSRADVSIAQDVFFKLKGTTQKFQVRMDILNFGNLLNKNWGQGTSFTSTQPLITTSTSATATCRPTGSVTTAVNYCLRQISGNFINSTYAQTPSQNDVYRIQIGFRYIFNK